MKAITIGLFLLLLYACGSDKPKQSKTLTAALANSKSQRIAVLANIKPTGRISSNRFSDIVLDKRDCSYISSFEKGTDGQDRILVVKVSSEGQIIWETGQLTLGRATAITLDYSGSIWVTGFFSGEFNIGGKQLESDQKTHIFLAKINTDGRCEEVIISQGSGMPFNIQINTQGEILLGGVLGSTLSFGSTKITNPNPEQEPNFLAKFIKTGQCSWIKPLNGNIQRIKNDSKGDFYVTGSFFRPLSFGKDTLFTESTFDSDGFLLKVSEEEEQSWIRQFGSVGHLKKGYRTTESGMDVSISSTDQILVAARQSPTTYDLQQFTSNDHSKTDLHLLIFSPQGQLLQKQLLAQQILARSTVCATFDAVQHIWIGGSAGQEIIINEKVYSLEGDSQSFLIHLNSTLELQEVIFPNHQKNMLFRAANFNQQSTVFAGHYQNSLQIDDLSITNDGRHGIFFYGLSN